MRTKTVVPSQAKKAVYPPVRATPKGRVPYNWYNVWSVAPRPACVSNVNSAPFYKPLSLPSTRRPGVPCIPGELTVYTL